MFHSDYIILAHLRAVVKCFFIFFSFFIKKVALPPHAVRRRAQQQASLSSVFLFFLFFLFSFFANGADKSALRRWRRALIHYSSVFSSFELSCSILSLCVSRGASFPTPSVASGVITILSVEKSMLRSRLSDCLSIYIRSSFSLS